MGSTAQGPGREGDGDERHGDGEPRSDLGRDIDQDTARADGRLDRRAECAEDGSASHGRAIRGHGGQSDACDSRRAQRDGEATARRPLVPHARSLPNATAGASDETRTNSSG